MNNIDVLILDIKGKFAHFRKFYTNSSSLSYSVPPRTTIEGIIAAILGYERDSYYEKLCKKNFNIAVRKMKSTRKIMQSLNYIKATKKDSVYTIGEGHTQIPFELITSDEVVHYRVYLSSVDNKIIDNIEKRAKQNKYIYAPYLGAAPFNCYIDYVDRIKGTIDKTDKSVEISTLINSSCISECCIDLKRKDLFLVKEKMPSDILKNRVIGEINSYIYDENGSSLNVVLNSEFVKLNYKDCIENIIFM
ncbi:type I-B CRISPR-associated protein Cas5b [Haloimpatiens sp. FM7330]|uniref:type I-B CRISPR-associated protein Cas5b n=1 Tax=Haloimpatiens sp. FM7330 TaxID=3298610 RepID=UPI0036394F46